MKHKITYAFCAFLLIAVFYGLTATAEAGLPEWETLGIIVALLLFGHGVAKVATLTMKKEGRA